MNHSIVTLLVCDSMEIKHPQQPPFNSHDKLENRWIISRWKIVENLLHWWCLRSFVLAIRGKNSLRRHKSGTYGNLFTTSERQQQAEGKIVVCLLFNFTVVDSLSIFHCTHTTFIFVVSSHAAAAYYLQKKIKMLKMLLKGVESKRLQMNLKGNFIDFFCDSSQRFLLFLFSPI